MEALLTLPLIAALVFSTPGFSCVDPLDPSGRRWFQDDPCPPGLVNSPLPLPVHVDDPTPSPYRFLPGLPASDGSPVRSVRHRHGGHGIGAGRAGRRGMGRR